MKLKELKDINLNKLAQGRARKVAIGCGIGLCVLGLGLLLMIHAHKKQSVVTKPNKPNAFSSAIDQVAFSGVHHQELIDQQNTENTLSHKYDQLQKQLDAQTKAFAKLKKEEAVQKQSLVSLPKKIAQSAPKQTQPATPQFHLHNPEVSPKTQENLAGNRMQNSIGQLNMFDFSYASPVDKNDKYSHYVPSGSFAQAVVLSGADGDAGTNGSKRSAPILLQITSKVIEPNHRTSDLTGCFVTASTYGDISSERNLVQLVSLSCNRADGSVLDLGNVEGFVSDGIYGVRGRVVMRNGKLLFYSGLSGFASGVGEAIKDQATIQSTSALGATSTIDANKTFQAGGANGASTALGKLADYYIKRADQYHSIVELNPGSHVTIVFQKGFSTDPNNKDNLKPPQQAQEAQSTQSQIDIAKQLRQAGLGSTIGVNHAH